MIASLILTTAINATDNSTHYVLDASQSNSTQMLLVPLPSNSSSDDTSGNSSLPSGGNSSMIPVNLQMNLFDPDQAMTVPYCATFGPDPNKPEPISMESCGSPEPGKSQRFAYEPDTSVLKPMFIDVQPVNNSTAPDSPVSNSTSSSSKRDAFRRQQSPQPNEEGQKVQLVFVPNEASTDGSTPSANYADDSQYPDGSNPSSANSDSNGGTGDNDDEDASDAGSDSDGPSSNGDDNDGDDNASDAGFNNSSENGSFDSDGDNNQVGTSPTSNPSSPAVNAVETAGETPIFIAATVSSTSASSTPTPSSSPSPAALGVMVENMSSTGPLETPSFVNASAVAASLAAQPGINNASGMSRRSKQEKW
jgi:hypothetical protein